MANPKKEKLSAQNKKKNYQIAMCPMEVIFKNISSSFSRQTATYPVEMNSLEETDKKERKPMSSVMYIS